MQILPAQAAHFVAIYPLLCELEETPLSKALMQEIFLRNLADTNVHYLVAVENKNNAVLGFASLHINHLLHHAAKIGELQEIIVRKESQNAGIGRALFAAIKQVATKNGCAQLEVCCNKARVQSHGFYIKQGAKNSHYKFTMTL